MTESEKPVSDLIESIDSEIHELETLISLQQKKVELLSRKNALLKQSENASFTLTIDSCEKNSLYRESHAEKGRNSIIELNKLGTANPLVAKNAESELTKSSKIEDGKATDQQFATTTLTKQEKTEISVLTSVQRMSRLTTDLANERNLLAWGRTALAAARTALAFLGVTALTLYGEVMAQFVTISFMVLALVFTIHAVHRYHRIKEILMMPDPSLEFRRLSNKPLYLALTLLFLLALVTIASQQWS